MKATKTLIVKKAVADKIKVGDYVKLGKLCQDDSGLVITKTDKVIAILVDNGCYVFEIQYAL